jgi:ribosomal protein L37AE/L43A
MASNKCVKCKNLIESLDSSVKASIFVCKKCGSETNKYYYMGFYKYQRDLHVPYIDI